MRTVTTRQSRASSAETSFIYHFNLHHLISLTEKAHQPVGVSSRSERSAPRRTEKNIISKFKSEMCKLRSLSRNGARAWVECKAEKSHWEGWRENFLEKLRSLQTFQARKSCDATSYSIPALWNVQDEVKRESFHVKHAFRGITLYNLTPWKGILTAR